MKILFVDQNSDLQQKWIEPLRSEGWGVLSAQSIEDAEKILEFHGDSLNFLITSESFVDWAEKQNYAYLVLMKTWKEFQVVKHQNSSPHQAIAYLDYDSTLEQVKLAIAVPQQSVRSTGTEGQSSIEIAVAPDESPKNSSVISLEKYAGLKNEVEATSFKKESLEDKTVMFDPTSVSELNLSSDLEAFINEKAEDHEVVEETSEPALELSSEIETVVEAEPEPELKPELQPAVEESFSIEPQAESTPEISMSSFSPGNKDLDTMKNYLALREQDVALLTGQLRSAQERVQQLELQTKVERARSGELQHLLQKQDQQIKNFERDKQVEFEVLYQQVEDLNLQLRERTDKIRTIEAKFKITTDEVEKVKERVRVDIRRIRVREKELEGQLEILKKDSTALLVARDDKILELKRKLDLLEFNMELVQEQYGKERNATEQLRHKLKEASTVMKRAGGLLDSSN